jgi:drug/metabolite transporter (DMT)-like permease
MIAPRTVTSSLGIRWTVPPLPVRAVALLAVIGATVIWGSSSVVTKIALTDVSPTMLAFTRLVLAYVILRPLVARSEGRPARGLLPALLGLTGFAGFVLLRNFGLGGAPASHGSLIEGGATPALGMLLALALLAERPSTRRLTGMGTSLVGVGIAVVPGMEGSISASLGADSVLLAGTACFALYTVLGRRACAEGGSLGVVVGAMRYGLLILAPFALAELVVTGVPTLTPVALGALIYLGAVCSAAAFALWGYGLSHLAAGQVALLSNLELVCGIVVAAGLAGEAFAPLQIGGAALVLAGIWYGTTSVTLPRPMFWRRVHMLPTAAG